MHSSFVARIMMRMMRVSAARKLFLVGLHGDFAIHADFLAGGVFLDPAREGLQRLFKLALFKVAFADVVVGVRVYFRVVARTFPASSR